ncbi:MAG: metallophosphoesterase, partial [Bacteroidales bacterium]|nr:metallophosphoesterase [Bacteroidales bacterium]
LVLRTALDANEIFRTRPYLQNPADGGITVMWETVIPAYSWVEYGTDTLNLQRERLLVDGQAEFNESIHKIRLENLEPGRKYFYRVCSQEILYYGGYHKIFGNTAVSPFYTFAAPDTGASEFTAIVFNDLHQRKHVFEALFEQVKDIDYDFVVFNGDCIDDPVDRDQVTGFIKILTETVGGSSIPTMFLRGNHEIRNAYSIRLRKHMDYPGGKTYSAFNWGDTRIVVLDCGEDKKDDHKEYSGLNDFTSLRLEQVDFLKNELSSKEFKKADKRILFHHIPIYGMIGGNLCEPLWRPLLDKAPFDVALHGHTHQFAFHPAGTCQNRYPVIIGGGKGTDNSTVMILSKTKNTLKVRVLGADGKILLDWEE